MGRVGSRPKWQTAVLVVFFTGGFTAVVLALRQNPLIQGVIFAVFGAGLSLTAWREETRRGKLARLFMGPFVFSTFLYAIAEVNAALVPALVLWLLTGYYSFSDLVSEDPLGVHDDRTEEL